MTELLQAHTWLLLVAIFLSRILDQTFGVLRTISIFRGFSVLAGFVGFVEVLIWINVAGQVIRNLDTWYLAVVYAAGFAAGNGVGVQIERRLAIGFQMVRVISKREVDLANKLWERNFAVTEMQGESKAGPIDVIFVAEKRRNVPKLAKLITELDPEAFFTVEDVKQIGFRSQPDPGVAWGKKLFERAGEFVISPMEKTRKMWKRK
jgi:uncharacterized protein YebE (UPF0316 family)